MFPIATFNDNVTGYINHYIFVYIYLVYTYKHTKRIFSMIFSPATHHILPRPWESLQNIPSPGLGTWDWLSLAQHNSSQ